MPGATDTGATYEVTETEQATATNVLINLLFTVVETPTHADRRRREEPAAREGDAAASDRTDAEASDSTDAGEGTDFGVTGYAGPE